MSLRDAYDNRPLVRAIVDTAGAYGLMKIGGAILKGAGKQDWGQSLDQLAESAAAGTGLLHLASSDLPHAAKNIGYLLLAGVIGYDAADWVLNMPAGTVDPLKDAVDYCRYGWETLVPGIDPRDATAYTAAAGTVFGLLAQRKL